MTDPADILARIDAAETSAVLLCGPAASGKTSALLELHRRCGEDGSGATLVVPNVPTESSLRRTLLQRSGGVIAGTRVLTFAALTARVLTAMGRPAAVLSELDRHLLLRRIVTDLDAEGRLPALHRVANTPGLVPALDRAIAELKRAAVEPDDLAPLLPRGRDKRRDLHAVYAAYQQHLQQSGAVDVEGIAWLARQELSAAADGTLADAGLPDAGVLLLDGFTDFTPTQLTILAVLSRRAKRLVVTLPLSDDGRQRLWRWTARTADRLAEAFDGRLSRIDLPASPQRSPFAPLWDALLDPDAELVSCPPGLHVLAGTGPESEVRHAAHRAKKLLLEGASAGSIAVLARSLDEYRPHVERIFPACGVPVIEAPVPLTEVPVVRFVLNAARLGGDSACEYATVLSVLRSSYFRPEALGRFTASDVAAAELIIREGNVLQGRTAYQEEARRLGARADALPAPDDTDEETPTSLLLGPLRLTGEDLLRAGELMGALLDATKPADTAAGLAEMIDHLDVRSAAMQAGEPELIARDLRALDALSAALQRVETPCPPPEVLAEALSAVRLPGARGEAAVDVLDVLDARATRYDHVILLGLSEGRFPAPPSEGAMLTDADRRRWADRGLALDSRRDLTAREMVLFYLAATRAEKTLQLCFSRSDAGGRASGPGCFLESLLDALGGLENLPSSQRTRIPTGRFVPPTDEIASPREARIAALAGLLDPTYDPSGAALRWCAAHEESTLSRAAGGMLTTHRRWLPGPADRYDGRLSDPKLLEKLRQQFPTRHVFSASALNTFGQCPWAFFARYVLHLRPLAEPQRSVQAVSRGTFIHNVLCDVFLELRRREDGPVPIRQIDSAVVEELLDESIAAQTRRHRPALPVLWEIEVREMRRAMLEYILLLRSQSEPSAMACYMELGFGMGHVPADVIDPASRSEPLVLETPAGAVRVRGKIDRVDRVNTDAGEQWYVVDYKTGRLPAHKDIDGGRALQIPLYVEAAEQLLDGRAHGGEYSRVGRGESRVFADGQSPRGEKRTFDERRHDIRRLIGEYVGQMAEGDFDLLRRHECTSYCPYRQVCQFSPARLTVKQPGDAGEEACS